MKLLFLRGQVPTDRDPRQIIFDDIDECDDMWTQLAREMCKDDYGEIWYWGGKRKVQYTPSFVERWVKNFDKVNPDFTPDVVFARGGFRQYDGILSRMPGFKIYYGAGRRHVPQSSFKAYNLILTDSHRQRKEVETKFNIQVSVFPKPAAENVFFPRPAKKIYDVIFVGNEARDDKKGHNYALSTIPRDKSVLCVGSASGKLRSKFPHVKFTGWIPRKQIPAYYAQSKVSLVCAAKVDSCPRVIPESLACNCPLLVLDSVRFWKDKYITESTGELFSSQSLVSTLDKMLMKLSRYSPYEHYRKNLSLSCSAEFIRGLVQ